jgi:MarR family transcriptional regulator, organic hydroperoxide resistance regulator
LTARVPIARKVREIRANAYVLAHFPLPFRGFPATAFAGNGAPAEPGAIKREPAGPMTNRNSHDPSNPGFRLENSPFYLMAHVDFKYHEDMDKVLHKHGVSKPIYRIMTVLRERQPASIGMLAEVALTKRSTVSRIVDRMVEQGLATAEPNPDDNRITEVTLTTAGQQTLRKLTPIVGRQFHRAFEGISEREINSLLKTLTRISANLSKLPIE